MTYIRHIAHDAAMFAALAGGLALSMLVAKGAADLVVGLGGYAFG